MAPSTTIICNSWFQTHASPVCCHKFNYIPNAQPSFHISTKLLKPLIARAPGRTISFSTWSRSFPDVSSSFFWHVMIARFYPTRSCDIWNMSSFPRNETCLMDKKKKNKNIWCSMVIFFLHGRKSCFFFPHVGFHLNVGTPSHHPSSIQRIRGIPSAPLARLGRSSER